MGARVMGEKHFSLEQIGVVHSCFSEKFGIPRQPRLARHAVGQIEFFERFSRPEMVKELKAFSHIWVHFIFHQSLGDGWRPTVRPPFLGGQQRVGVFASRTPHRPNFLGLSAVALDAVKYQAGKTLLEVSGLDILDQTPVVDIRPYLPYSDVVAGAQSGYADREKTSLPDVHFSPQALTFTREYHQKSGKNLEGLVIDVLQQDPRPASQRDRDKEFGVLLWDVNVRFFYQENGDAFVVSCSQQLQGKEQVSP